MSEMWSDTFSRYRAAKGWSLTEAARAFIAVSALHSPDQLDSVRRTITRWEQGGIEEPSRENQAAIARMFDLPIRAFFPPKEPAAALPARLTADAWTDLMAQLDKSTVSSGVLDTAEAEVERLRTAYASEPTGVVLDETEQWGRYLVGVRGGLDLRSMTRAYDLLGKLSLLRACLLYDLNDRDGAELARRAAIQFAKELGDIVNTCGSRSFKPPPRPHIHRLIVRRACRGGTSRRPEPAPPAAVRLPHATVAEQPR